MPGDLYDRDFLAWSVHQADLLRRTARGERVNHVDWENVAEEIEGVGLSELHAVQSYLDLILVHLLKLHAWPNSDAQRHWRAEIAGFQANARRRFAASMRQRIDLDAQYTDALDQVRPLLDDQETLLRPWPEANPFCLDAFLTANPGDLLTILADAGTG